MAGGVLEALAGGTLLWIHATVLLSPTCYLGFLMQSFLLRLEEGGFANEEVCLLSWLVTVNALDPVLFH